MECLRHLSSGHVATVRLLLEKRADANCRHGYLSMIHVGLFNVHWASSGSYEQWTNCYQINISVQISLYNLIQQWCDDSYWEDTSVEQWCKRAVFQSVALTLLAKEWQNCAHVRCSASVTWSQNSVKLHGFTRNMGYDSDCEIWDCDTCKSNRHTVN